MLQKGFFGAVAKAPPQKGFCLLLNATINVDTNTAPTNKMSQQTPSTMSNGDEEVDSALSFAQKSDVFY